MTQLYFHCSNTKKVFVDQRGAVVDGPAEARDYATRVVQSFTNERSLEDWRDWILHSATIRAMSSSLFPSFSYSASRIEVAMLTVKSPRAPIGRSFAARQIRAYWTTE